MKTNNPKDSVEPKVVDPYGFVSKSAGPFAMAVGGVVLVGWLMGIPMLTTVMPGFVTMKPNTAFCFIIAGLSLFLSRRPSIKDVESRLNFRFLGQICALFIACIGLLTLGEYWLNLNLGIDQALLRDAWTDVRVSPPGRMSMATALEFVALGGSLFFLYRKRPRDALASQILALSCLISATLACLGYLYGAVGPYTISFYTTMALHTALVFLFLSAGTLFARPESGLISAFTSQYSGGQMARLILPLAVTLPFVISWLRLKGEQAGLYRTQFGLAVFATSNIVLFATLIWIGARLLNRRSAELLQGGDRYRFLADTMPQIVWTARPDGNLDYYNRRWFDYTGMTIEETKDWGWKHVVHPDDLQNCVERWTRAFTTDCDYEVEYRFKRASDGTYRWHLGRAFPLRNHDREILQWVGTSTDIDDQKRARYELEKRVAERSAELSGAKEKLQAVLDAASHVSIIASDTTGLITVFNQGAEQMLGYSAGEMVGKQSPAILHLGSEMFARGQELTEEFGRPVHGYDVFVEKARSGQHDEHEWTYVRKNGTTLTVNLVVTAAYGTNGAIVGFLGVAMDVTARAKAEQTSRDQALILDLANDTIIIRDIEDRITYWNQGAVRLYGWSKEEAMGRVTHSLFRTQFSQPLGEIKEKLFATGHWEGDLVHTRRDGALVNVISSWTLRRDESKRPASVIEMNYDVTARKKAEKELTQTREHLDTIVSSSLDGIVVYEAIRDERGQIRDLRFVVINPAAEKLMRRNASELLGRTVSESYPSVLKDGLFEKYIRIIEENVPLDFEHQAVHGGSPHWYRIAGVKLADGLALSYTEITPRKLFEQQLQEAKEHAELADEAKSDFLATMSHEIRTPMNGVIGVTGLLLDSGLNAEQRQLAETIRNSGESLVGLINDILDFSKIEAGELSFEELDFNLRQVTEETLELLAGQAQVKGIELVGSVGPEVPPTVRGDPGRLRQVLTNLIANGIKFTKFGEVALHVSLKEETGVDICLRFEIKDTGVGLSAETQARLFQPFVQADSSTSRKFGGTGLGLAICKRLAELMNGRIGVESSLGKGSMFWVELRFRRHLVAGEQALTQHQFGDIRVLVVDDNETSRRSLREQIVARQMRSEIARSGEEALTILHRALVEKAPYKVAIIDMQMPGMDGLALARNINADPLLNGTRLILLTPSGKPVPADQLEMARIGASCVKPVRQSALFESLAQVLARSANETRPVSSPATAKPVRKGRILLAEDNAINQRVALGNLRWLGYEADIAANGVEVLRALEEKGYDIILMDCQMPELDGYEVTREIRRREGENRRIWIIAMTADVMGGVRERCLAAGMDDYLAKPLRRAELNAALERGTASLEKSLGPQPERN
jgi:two-component system sensor histidine kinase/response regulator